MTTNYPSALDDGTTLPSSYNDSTPTVDEHEEKHDNLSDALIAIETELGVLPKGGFSSVAARLAGMITKTPSSSQTVQPAGDYIALALRAHATQTVKLLEIRTSADAVVGSIDKDGNLDAASYQQGGAALASTHMSDTSVILKNPSPSITTPTISSPAMTGTTAAPTPSTADNSTKIATTAYVIAQALAKLASPALTGTPVAPTASVDTNTTQIATTAFVKAQIAATPTPPPPTGLVLAYGGSSAPSGWLMCDGSAVSQSTYAALYAVIGVTYGDPGGGNFNLPDLKGRFAVGKGTHVDVDTLADNEGVAEASRRPKHSHVHTIDLSSNSNHTHGGITSGGGGDHTHGTTVVTGSQGTAPGSGLATSGSSTGSGGGSTHSLLTPSGGSHTHSLSGTMGLAGITDSGGYITTNYIIKT